MDTFTLDPEAQQIVVGMVRSASKRFPIRVATAGHDLPCSTCSFTIPAATPYYRIDGETYCPNCGQDFDGAPQVMARWEREQTAKVVERMRSEKLIARRERAQQERQLATVTEWVEALETEG